MLFLQVTDELFNEIATRVLNEEDLAVDGWYLPFSNLFLSKFLLSLMSLRSGHLFMRLSWFSSSLKLSKQMVLPVRRC